MRFSLLVPRAILVLTTAAGWAQGPAAAAPGFFGSNWRSGWSGVDARGEDASQLRMPDGQQPIRFCWQKAAGKTLATFGRGFPPERLAGDVLAFWLRADRPLEKLQVVLTDADGVGAETSVLGLLGMSRLEPGKWYYVVWPLRVSPGWVRYTRSTVDWQRIRELSFYTWPDQLSSAARVEIGSFRVVTFAELEDVFCRFPDWAGNNRSLSWRVLREKRDGIMGGVLPPPGGRRHPCAADVMAGGADRPPDGSPPASLGRHVSHADGEGRGFCRTDGILHAGWGAARKALTAIASRGGLDRLAPAAPAGRGYRPRRPPADDCDAAGAWRSFLVAFIPGAMPFVRGAAGSSWRSSPSARPNGAKNPRWSESHDTQAMAFLLTAGQSLMGLIMADHQAELSWLLKNPRVDAKRVAVTGVSMGGTHSLWFAALDPRARAAVAVAVAPEARASWACGPQGLCDLMVGLFRVADDDLIRALVAPRPFLEICPSVQAPLSAEGERRCQCTIGGPGYAEALKRYPLTPDDVRALHPLTRQTYALLGAEGRYGYEVIEGPHDYTRLMRERAAGFLTGCWQRGNAAGSLAEPTLTPIRERKTACDMLDFWPHGPRPADILSPTAYVQREMRALIGRLRPPPKTREAWRAERAELRRRILALVGTPWDVRQPVWSRVGTFRAERGKGRKLVTNSRAGNRHPHAPVPAGRRRPPRWNVWWSFSIRPE